jgi:hypothetical protein
MPGRGRPSLQHFMQPCPLHADEYSGIEACVKEESSTFAVLRTDTPAKVEAMIAEDMLRCVGSERLEVSWNVSYW